VLILFGYVGDFHYIGDIRNNVMTEEIFEQLGFEKVVVTMEESGCDADFYYYSIDIGDICIISNADDEAAKDGWEAYIFDSLTMRVKGSGDLEDLVRIIRNNTNG
jgi:hypothetical protein